MLVFKTLAFPFTDMLAAKTFLELVNKNITKKVKGNRANIGLKICWQVILVNTILNNIEWKKYLQSAV